MRTLARLVAVSAVLAVMSACGSSPTATSGSPASDRDDAASAATEVYDRFNAMTGQERTDALLAAAKEEGTVSIYTSNTDMEKIAKGFSDTHGIDVQIYRAPSEAVLQRILQEAEANYAGVDFTDNNAGELDVLADKGLTYEYKSEFRDKVRKEGQLEGWTATYFNAFVIGYNTDLVPGAERPTSLKELADPKWKGRISMELGDVDWFAGMWKYYEAQGMSETEIEDLFRRLAANSLTVKGHTVQGQLLSAGQYAVGVSMYSHTIDKDAAKGAPVAWRTDQNPPAEPVVLRPNGAALMKSAQNPAAAMLLMDYMLTDGQAAMAEVQRIPAVQGSKDPLAGLEITTTPLEELLKDSAAWNKRYEDIVSGGTQVEAK